MLKFPPHMGFKHKPQMFTLSFVYNNPLSLLSLVLIHCSEFLYSFLLFFGINDFASLAMHFKLVYFLENIKLFSLWQHSKGGERGGEQFSCRLSLPYCLNSCFYAAYYFYLFIKYIQIFYFVPDSILGPGNTAVNITDTNP